MPNVHGRPLHTRSLTIIISRKSDSVWHARGDVIDLRKHSFVPLIDDIQPAGVIHMMSIDLDFDSKTLRIEEIAVDQPFVAIESSAATGGDCCRDPASLLLDLRGEVFDRTFTKRLSAVFGGRLGCSHLLTLFQLMASTIPRAVRAETDRVADKPAVAAIGGNLNSCYMWREEGHVAKTWGSRENTNKT